MSCDYIQSVIISFENQDSQTLTNLLSLNYSTSEYFQSLRPEGSYVLATINDSLSELIKFHIKAMASKDMDINESYECEITALDAFGKLFQAEKESNWNLLVLNELCKNVKVFGFLLCSIDALEKGINAILNIFRVIACDTRPANAMVGKKWGMIYVANHLSDIYFKSKRSQMINPLVKAIEQLSFLSELPIAQLVTYRYFYGRKLILEGEFEKANECLTFAFSNCPDSFHKNKRAILVFLIPLKIYLGYRPSNFIIEKYFFVYFADIVKSIVSGDIRLFQQNLEKYQIFYARRGILLLVQRLELFVYRTLFLHVFRLYGSHQIPISLFTKALELGLDSDGDENQAICLLATLIHLKRIRGYIAPVHNVLVVSKQLAFPSLCKDK